MASGKKIGYIRVSTFEQNTDRQLDGVALDKIFTDKASGKSKERPALEALLEYAREEDTVFVHSMDRLARNLDDLRQLVKLFNAKAVTIQFVKENLSFTGEDSPMSNLMLSVMGAFAEFERSLIKERQLEGITLAKEKGKFKGRKPKLNEEATRELLKRVQSGEYKTQIANDLSISRKTLYQYFKKANLLNKTSV